jgi:hypothetical protein
MNMWAGAGVGGLRTPARCLDSISGYPCPCEAKRVRCQRLFAATARCNWLLFMLERPSTRRRFAWL